MSDDMNNEKDINTEKPEKSKEAEKRKKDKLKERIGTVLFMLAVTIVFISVLSLLYLLTKDKVKANETLYIKRAVLYAAGITIPKTDQEVDKLYSERIKETRDNSGQLKYYEVLAPPESGKETVTGYIFLTNGAGLWGTITSLVGVAPDAKTLTGVTFVKDNETPGLGARINENWFKEQFRGKQGPFTRVGEKETADKNQFEAITGATITSAAVQNILNKTLAEAPKELGKVR